MTHLQNGGPCPPYIRESEDLLPRHHLLCAAIMLAAITIWPTMSKADDAPTTKPVVLKAEPFSLNDVRLLDGSPFKHAQDLDAAYLLSLDPDRLLHNFRVNAGL